MCDTSFLQGCCECAARLGEERKQIDGEGGGMTTAKLGVPFHRHGFMTNWGPGIRDGCRGHLLFFLAWICNEKN